MGRWNERMPDSKALQQISVDPIGGSIVRVGLNPSGHTLARSQRRVSWWRASRPRRLLHESKSLSSLITSQPGTSGASPHSGDLRSSIAACPFCWWIAPIASVTSLDVVGHNLSGDDLPAVLGSDRAQQPIQAGRHPADQQSEPLPRAPYQVQPERRYTTRRTTKARINHAITGLPPGYDSGRDGRSGLGTESRFP